VEAYRALRTTNVVVITATVGASPTDLPVDVYLVVMKERAPVKPELFGNSRAAADRFLDQLLWWTHALKVARQGMD
jgi:hypothetical protein